MQSSGEIKKNILSAAILVALLLLFGTPASANIAVKPSILNFGNQTVGTTSASITVTLSNANKRSITIASGSVLGAQFSYSGPSMPVTLMTGQSVTASVTFKPAAAQTYSGTLVFTRANGSSITVSLSGTGVSAAGQPPAITNQPSNQTILAGQSATFSVAATGTAPITYQWKKNGIAITGASASSYSTPPETTSDTNSQFSVTVANPVGNANSNAAMLTVTAPVVAPSITTQPSSKTITAGQTATFSVAAAGTAPMTYQWMKNAIAISGATSSSYTTPAETTADNSAQFTVTVSNGAGTANSSAAILTVNAAAVAPSITTQPSSQTVNAGQTATFNVAATGTSPMTYQWKKNSLAISGATSSTYTTPATTSSDNAAQFTVVLSNSAGSATSTAATLTVNTVAVAPTITTQPASKAVVAGQTATFSVAASGTSPMTYQWVKNSVAIGGATSASYTTPAETTADNNAQFSVTVTNSAGNATSNPATLTVNAATLVLNSSATALSFGNVNVLGSSTKNVTLTNAGNSSVTVSSVTVNGAGFTGNGVPTGLILNPGQIATLAVTFSPSSAGSVTGSASVASNASNSPDGISLSGTGMTVVNHSATLSWTPSPSTVMGYNTYSGTKSGGPYAKLTSAPTAGTSYTDATVQAGLTYYYVVTAVDSSGTESAFSTETSAIIP